MAKALSLRVARQLLPMTVVGLTASLTLFGIVRFAEYSSSESLFRELADQRIIAIRANIAIAQDSVNLLVGHFAAAPAGSTSREGFGLIVQKTLSDHGFIQGLSWDPRIRRAERPAYEAAARRDGLDGFMLTERAPDGTPVPVAERDEYVPIYYMEPVVSNMRALGFDLASHPVRREALHTGRDRGQPQATGRITLVQENADQYGVLLLAPVFGRQGPRDVESNRRNLTGYVSGVFRIGDLISSSAAGGSVASALPLVDIHLFDMSAAERERRLYPIADAEPLETLTAGLHESETFSMAGRDWLLIATPSAAFKSANSPAVSYVMLLVALLATGSYLSFLKGRITQAEYATTFAREVTRAKKRLGEAQRIAKLVSLELDTTQGQVSAGEGAPEMLGLPSDQRHGTVDSVLVNVVPRDRHLLRATLLGGNTMPIDVEFSLEIGAEIRTLHALAGDMGEAGHVIITLQDVTARKAAEEERAAMIERIAEADRFEALGTLAGGIAHEINTPTQYVGDNIAFMKEGLTTLLDLAETARTAASGGQSWDGVAHKLASAELEFLQAELPAAADQALDGTRRIARIVQAIKEFSYPSSKSPRPVDLNHLIDVVATVTRNQWKYVAEVDYDFDPQLPKILAIEGEINQILVNLMVNAAQAIAEKGESALGRIVLRTRNLGDEVELTITDTGAGIRPENLKQIFEMFFTTKAPGQGTGQGLAITKAIIHRHGGRIAVESDPGSGACFRIRLPLTPPDTVSQFSQSPEGR